MTNIVLKHVDYPIRPFGINFICEIGSDTVYIDYDHRTESWRVNPWKDSDGSRDEDGRLFMVGLRVTQAMEFGEFDFLAGKTIINGYKIRNVRLRD